MAVTALGTSWKWCGHARWRELNPKPLLARVGEGCLGTQTLHGMTHTCLGGHCIYRCWRAQRWSVHWQCGQRVTAGHVICSRGRHLMVHEGALWVREQLVWEQLFGSAGLICSFQVLLLAPHPHPTPASSFSWCQTFGS